MLRTYQALLDRHCADPEKSYLSPDKLYALVDLGVQVQKIPWKYPGADTEAIHRSLYRAGRIRKHKSEPDEPEHRVWVTALVHKEAYFVLPPACRAVFGQPDVAVLDDEPLTLARFCERAVLRIRPEHAGTDRDLAKNFTKIVTRIEPFRDRLETKGEDHKAVADSIAGAHASSDYGDGSDTSCTDLIAAIFSLTKAKPIWERIIPAADIGWTRSSACYRDQLALKVAREVSNLEDTDHPLAGFFRYLKARH